MEITVQIALTSALERRRIFAAILEKNVESLIVDFGHK